MATRIKEKAEARWEGRDRRPAAHARYIRISASKMRIVLDIIRGRKYNEAVAILENTPNFPADVIVKVVNSAAANAEHNLNLAKSDLYVAEAYANEGPTLKRMTTKAKGSGARIFKRSCHVTVILDAVAK